MDLERSRLAEWNHAGVEAVNQRPEREKIQGTRPLANLKTAHGTLKRWTLCRRRPMVLQKKKPALGAERQKKVYGVAVLLVRPVRPCRSLAGAPVHNMSL